MGGLQASLASSWEHVYQVCSDRRVIEEIKGFFILIHGLFFYASQSKCKQAKHAQQNLLCLWQLLHPSHTSNVCDGPLCKLGFVPVSFLLYSRPL